MKPAIDSQRYNPLPCVSCLVPTAVLRKNSSRDGFQLVVMMQAAETGVGNDTKSGW